MLLNKKIFTSIVVALVALSTYGAYLITNQGLITIDLAAWGIFFTIFGVIYPIVLGFLLVEALGKYGNLSKLLDEEVNELQDMRDALIFLDNSPEIEDRIYQTLKNYALSIADHEWDDMVRPGSRLGSDTSEELYQFMRAIHAIDPTNKSDEEVLNILINKVFTITTLRTQRINLAKQSLPNLLHILINFMAVVFMVALNLSFAATIDSFWIQFAMVVSLVTSTHLLYQIIIDLDSPFSGSWKLDYRDEYRQFAQSVDAIEERCTRWEQEDQS